MDQAQTTRLTELLNEAQRAHGTYEATELNGVFDEAWPQWYAEYMVDHGLADIVGRYVTAEQAADHLASAYAEYDRTDPKPDTTWAEYVARVWPDEP